MPVGIWNLRYTYVHKCVLLKCKCDTKNNNCAASPRTIFASPNPKHVLTALGYSCHLIG